jgi:hypothetical protein
VNRDWIELLAEFNARAVDYLVVGAHALAAHGHVRATKDLDIWVRPGNDNAPRVFGALVAFGAPLHDLTADDLAVPDRIVVHLDGTPVPVISRHHLIANKKASGRLQDLADVERLEEIDG